MVALYSIEGFIIYFIISATGVTSANNCISLWAFKPKYSITMPFP